MRLIRSMLVPFGRCQQLTTKTIKCNGHDKTVYTGVSGLYWVRVSKCKCGQKVEHNLPEPEVKVPRPYKKRPKKDERVYINL